MALTLSVTSHYVAPLLGGIKTDATIEAY